VYVFPLGGHIFKRRYAHNQMSGKRMKEDSKIKADLPPRLRQAQAASFLTVQGTLRQ